MEVFIAFDGNLETVPFLEEALNGWEKVRFAEPQVIELKRNNKFESRLRVIANGLAKGNHYILADIDAKPEEPYLVSQIVKRIALRLNCRAKEEREFGMAIIRPTFDVGGKVRVMLKNAIKKWPQLETDNYDVEYAVALSNAGYSLETWDDIWYRHLPKENPLLVN